MILPRKFRDELGQDMVITKGVGKERCLYVFPQAEFEAFAAKLHSQPLTARPTRDFARMFVAGASSTGNFRVSMTWRPGRGATSAPDRAEPGRDDPASGAAG